MTHHRLAQIAEKVNPKSPETRHQTRRFLRNRLLSWRRWPAHRQSVSRSSRTTSQERSRGTRCAIACSAARFLRRPSTSRLSNAYKMRRSLSLPWIYDREQPKGSSGDALGQQFADAERAQIDRFEIGEGGQHLDIVDDDDMPVDADEPILAELPQRAVDMRHAEAQRVADQLLGQRQAVGAFVGQTDRLQPGQQLQQEMRHPFERRAPS